MIQKILSIQNVGLFQNGVSNNPAEFGKVTLIYGENGRGKSTLAAVIHSLSTSDAGRIKARKTIDVVGEPLVAMLVNLTGQNSQVEFKNGAWTGTPPSILVFDSEFVEQNVYSGFEVRTDQRQALLEFALGDQLVSLKNKVDQMTHDIDAATTRRSAAEKILNTMKGTLSLQAFIDLRMDPDAQKKIDALSKRLGAAKVSQVLLGRRDPASMPSFDFDVQNVFILLSKTLDDVEKSAEQIVRNHLQKHSTEGVEDWINQGQDYVGLTECPFCGQSLAGLELIKSYQSYFSREYKKLKGETESIGEALQTAFAESTVESLKSNVATNDARIDAWKDQLPLTNPKLDDDTILALAKSVGSNLGALVAKKQLQPLEKIGSETEKQAIQEAISNVNKKIADYNAQVGDLTQEIAKFKMTLSSENIVTLQNDIRNFESVKKRYSADAVGAIEDYQSAHTNKGELETKKTEIRQQIDQLMQSTLQQYEGSINQLLYNLGAEFAIKKLKPSYIGSGEPRSEYGLEIRGQEVRLGTRLDITDKHAFGTTLSESDKRTMALAFFLARLEADSNLSDRIVVLDDPVSSLDRNRMHQTTGIAAVLAPKCKQLIVLSHDPHFLRDIRDGLSRLRPTPIVPKIFGILRVQQGYSSFGDCDIDDVCSSDYYRHHKIVSDYVDGKQTLPLPEVAKAIRPLVEGYYHRRFPRSIPRRTTLGNIIQLVHNASPQNPLANLKKILGEITEVNEYTSQFHHDGTNDGTVNVVDGQLRPYANKALSLIYENG